MPIRIPASEEHTELVTSFRNSLRSDSLETIVGRALDQSNCCCIDGETREALSNSIAIKFSLSNSTCIFVGSAKLGFSIAQKTDKPRYRSFSLQSDIDIAIVDPALYDRVWEQTFLGFVAERPWHHEQDFQKYFFRGWIRPDKLPYNSDFRSDWFDYFRNLSKEHLDSMHSINCGLYKSPMFLTEYHKLAAIKCRDAEEIQ